MSPYTQVNASPITKTTSWLKFLGKNLHLVGCATLCAKIEVMLTYVSIIWNTTIGVLWIWIMCWTYHFVRGRHKQWFPTTDCHRICRWGCFMNLWSWYSLKVETLSICSYLTEEIEIHRFSWTWFYRFFCGSKIMSLCNLN